MKYVLLIITALSLAAQQPTVRCIDGESCTKDGKAITPTTPVISPELAAKFWRVNTLATQAELLAVKSAVDHKAKATEVETVYAELKKICGDKFTVNDRNGLVCEAKPDTTKKTK